MNTPATKTVSAPRIHLNGTSSLSLIQSLDAAHDTIGQAMEALKDTAPNGRDYYTEGPAALNTAQDEHRARSLALHNVQAELYAIILAIEENETKATYTPRV